MRNWPVYLRGVAAEAFRGEETQPVLEKCESAVPVPAND